MAAAGVDFDVFRSTSMGRRRDGSVGGGWSHDRR